MFINFDEEAQQILLIGKKEMLDMGHNVYGIEHLFLAFLKCESFLSKKINEKFISYYDFKNDLLNLEGISSNDNEVFCYSKNMKKLFLDVIAIAREYKSNSINEYHLLISMIDNCHGVLEIILNRFSVDLEKMYEFLINDMYKKNNGKDRNKSYLEIYGKCIAQNEISNVDFIVERDNEINQLIQILIRKNKNNPLLIGDPGVGKTAIVEGLSQKIALGNVPKQLRNKKIYNIEMSNIVAGTKYRGEFEERFQKIIKEAEADKDIILFIDEIHTIVGAGGAEGAIDASNILKPSLARGRIKLIGATTYSEYKKTIYKDKALERRFQIIDVKEMNDLQTFNILSRNKDSFQIFHNVIITDDNIREIIKLSNKFLKNRKQPDKALDLLDSICAKKVIDDSIDTINNKCIDLEQLRNNRKMAIYNKDYRLAKRIKSEENKCILALNKYKLEITNIDIKKTIFDKLFLKNFIYENDRLKIYDRDILKNILFRNKEIKLVLNAITKKMETLSEKPVLFLIDGYKGSGKTFFIKTISDNLYGLDKMIIVDMEKYTENNSINNFLGSPLGYSGYNDDAIFENVLRNPFSIILIKNFESASLNIKEMFMEIFENGYIVNNKGDKIYFNNCIFFIEQDTRDNVLIGFNNMKCNLPKEKYYDYIDYKISFKKYSKKELLSITKFYLDKYEININLNDVKKYINDNDVNMLDIIKFTRCKENQVYNKQIMKDKDIIITN